MSDQPESTGEWTVEEVRGTLHAHGIKGVIRAHGAALGAAIAEEQKPLVDAIETALRNWRIGYVDQAARILDAALAKVKEGK